MTQSKFFYSDGVLTGFELTGHAGGVSGSDIVCAAVSSAAYMTANTITEVYKLPAQIQVDDGYMALRLNVADANRCRELLEGFQLHLLELQKQYPKKLKVLQTEV